jgi:two-component system, chemotaxis family, protein-glutamate methylesterase/glutaminase
MTNKIKVLIVDDSALIRNLLSEILKNNAQIEVVGTAIDPYDAREKIKQLNPDVITLDVEMPKMDGLSFLEKLMNLRPTPTIMVSTLTGKATDTAIAALELGAIDCIAKPKVHNTEELKHFSDELTAKIYNASKAKIVRTKITQTHETAHNYKLKLSAPKLIAIGASTGGVEAIGLILTKLPKQTPPIIITQHMPIGFTNSFAKRLSNICEIEVLEAADAMAVKSGRAIIACGDRHLSLKPRGSFYECKLEDGAAVSGHKPSVDVMFNSAAEHLRSDAIGIILTGMGRDGANGLLKMHQYGAHTIAQSCDSCVVYGMPRQAVSVGAANEIIDLDKIAEAIKQRCLQ